MTVSYGVKEWRAAIGDAGIISHVPTDGDTAITYYASVPPLDEGGRLALHPLSPEDALRGLLATPPSDRH